MLRDYDISLYILFDIWFDGKNWKSGVEYKEKNETQELD